LTYHESANSTLNDFADFFFLNIIYGSIEKVSSAWILELIVVL